MFSNILVTVGTTEFDDLISVVRSAEFCSVLRRCGCRSLTLQVGRGSLQPQSIEEEITGFGIPCSSFRYCDDLDRYMRQATLIISHGGAGSIIESLTCASKPYLVVVVNEALMGNHQLELADAMVSRGYCIGTIPEALLSLFDKAQLPELTVYPSARSELFPKYLTNLIYR